MLYYVFLCKFAPNNKTIAYILRETETFEEFFKVNFERFYCYALHLLNDEECSRDIVYDALEDVWRNYSNEEVDNWFRYTMSTVRNRCLDYIRHRAVHKRYADFFVHAVERQTEMGETEEDARLLAIRQIMETLSPRTRLVLQECYIHKKKYKEVAAELDISVNAVKKHIVKALKIIREEIATGKYPK